MSDDLADNPFGLPYWRDNIKADVNTLLAGLDNEQLRGFIDYYVKNTPALSPPSGEGQVDEKLIDEIFATVTSDDASDASGRADLLFQALLAAQGVPASISRLPTNEELESVQQIVNNLGDHDRVHAQAFDVAASAGRKALKTLYNGGLSIVDYSARFNLLALYYTAQVAESTLQVGAKAAVGAASYTAESIASIVQKAAEPYVQEYRNYLYGGLALGAAGLLYRVASDRK
jgi:hypothetical protein